VERFARLVAREEIEKNDFNLSPSRYIETAQAAEHRDVQTILDELAALESQAKGLDGELKTIFERLGYRVRR
jgi:type I restriction enzyme M protein